MFLVKYFRYSVWSIKRIYSFKNEKAWKVIIFFLLISLLACFPNNYQQIQQNGFTTGLFHDASSEYIATQNFARNTKFYQMSFAGLEVESGYDTTSYEEYEFKNFNLIIDYSNNFDNVPDKGVYVVYKQKSIVYYNEGSEINGNYNKFTSIIKSTELENDSSKFVDFFDYSADAFSKYSVIIGILVYTLTQTIVFLVLGLVLSWIYTFIKKSWDTFLTYNQILKIVIFSMTPGAFVCFIIGFFPNMFSLVPVIFNFGVAIISLLVMYKVARVDLDGHHNVQGKFFTKKDKKKSSSEEKAKTYLL